MDSTSGETPVGRKRGDTSADFTLRERLEHDRLRHRAAELDRVVLVLRARARAYGDMPRGLRLALSDFERQLASVRARLATSERGPTAMPEKRAVQRPATRCLASPAGARSSRLRSVGTTLVIEPDLRHAAQPEERETMFFRDPAGNALELKAFSDEKQVFAA